jgi:hypothetical protein
MELLKTIPSLRWNLLAGLLDHWAMESFSSSTQRIHDESNSYFLIYFADLRTLIKKCRSDSLKMMPIMRLRSVFEHISETNSTIFLQDDETNRNISAPLFHAPIMENSTSNCVRQSAESNVGAAESAGTTAHIIRLVERLRDLQRIVLPTQVVEAPDG